MSSPLRPTATLDRRALLVGLAAFACVEVSSADAAEETRAIAEKFVAALVENNTDAIAACAGEAPETY